MTTDRAEQILDVAEAEMRKGGYDAVSFRDIAAVVGIKSASVHYHFPTKSALGVGVTARYAKRFLAALGSPDAPQNMPQDRLARLAQAYIEAYEQRSALCLCAVLGVTSTQLPEDVVAEVNRFFQSVESWIATALGDTAEHLSAQLVLSLLQGAMVLAVVKKDVAPLHEARATIARLVGS